MVASTWLQPGLEVSYTVGWHPHFAARLLEEGQLDRLEKLLEEGRGRGCVAVGECGLDRSRGGCDMQVQVRAFTLQVQLALRLCLPLVLHIRGAEAEGRQVLREVGLPGTWPVHRNAAGMISGRRRRPRGCGSSPAVCWG